MVKWVAKFMISGNKNPLFYLNSFLGCNKLPITFFR